MDIKDRIKIIESLLEHNIDEKELIIKENNLLKDSQKKNNKLDKKINVILKVDKKLKKIDSLLSEQLQIALQILINNGYEILLGSNNNVTYKLVKDFIEIFKSDKIIYTDYLDSINSTYTSKISIIMSEKDLVYPLLLDKPFIFISEESDMLERIGFKDLFLNKKECSAGMLLEKIEYIKENKILIKEKIAKTFKDKKKIINNKVKEVNNIKSKELTSETDNMNEYKKEFKESIQNLIEQGLLENAKNMVEEYKMILGKDIEYYSMMGVIAMVEGNIEKAEEVFKKGLSFDSNNFNLLYNLGYLYQYKEDDDLAIKYYKKALVSADKDENRDEIYGVLEDLGVEESIEEIIKRQKNKKEKLKIVFMPYKISMWDSLETVYEEALKDKNTEVKVVPIPYYELAQDKKFPKYEGDKFPEHVEITHYSEYNLEEEKPDIVYVHNIYDQYNTITQVYEEYFTSNLKEHTDMLVYIPYHLPTFFGQYGRSQVYGMPGIENIDKVILPGEYMKKFALHDGIEPSKLLVLGSPKIDNLIRQFKKEPCYPEGWEEKLKNKTVYLLNTGVMHFPSDLITGIEEVINVFNIPKINKNAVVIWRPHPLTRASIKRYIPNFLDYYDNLIENHLKKKSGFYNNVIYDDTDDYINTLNLADILITKGGTLPSSFLFTEKRIIFLYKETPKGLVNLDDVYYSFYSKEEPWYELISKIEEGYDPLYKNRTGIAQKVYANTDGIAGENIYREIKKLVIE